MEQTPSRIYLLGELRLLVNAEIYTHFETRKTGALLACLALHPHGSQSRELLAEQLWPDEDPEATRNRLRQALSTLRRLLEPAGTPAGSVLIAGRNEARLNPTAVTTDVAEFEAAIKSAENPNQAASIQALRQAIELYTGDLLPGFIEDWISSERERLSEVYRAALRHLASALADSGDFAGAIEFARRAVACDTLDEEGHCALIRLYLAAGRCSDGLRQYRDLERILREELATVPSAATRQLLASLHSPAQTDPGTPGPSLLENLVTASMEPEGGAVPLDSPFYLVRPGDEQFQAAIARHDSIVLVKGARQIGKTSLLARGLQQARERGASVVMTDLQKLSTDQMASADALFRTFAEMIVDQLDLDLSVGEAWDPRRGWNVNFERLLRRDILSVLPSPLVWGLDEIDRLFECSFSSVVFGLFRSWHNERSLNPDGPWRRLTLAIAYATEAHLFITDLNQSPFNVGTRVTLEDFTEGELARLNRSYQSPLRDAAELKRFFRLVGGHPYLVRRGLHCMLAEGMGIGQLEARAEREDGIFGDHLRRMMASLARSPELCDALRAVVSGKPCPTSESFYRLQTAGLLSGDTPATAEPRCGLYRTYLRARLM